MDDLTDDILHTHYDYNPYLRQLFLHKNKASTGTIPISARQGMRVRRLNFGWARAAPVSSRPKPHITKASYEHPKLYRALIQCAEDISARYSDLLHHDHELPLTMGKTGFTGCVVNYSCAMIEHVDSSNIPGTRSAMLILKMPGCVGGSLELPDLDRHLDLRDGDLVIFDGGKHRHSVTPIKGERISIVFYTNKGIR